MIFFVLNRFVLSGPSNPVHRKVCLPSKGSVTTRLQFAFLYLIPSLFPTSDILPLLGGEGGDLCIAFLSLFPHLCSNRLGNIVFYVTS